MYPIGDAESLAEEAPHPKSLPASESHYPISRTKQDLCGDEIAPLGSVTTTSGMIIGGGPFSGTEASLR